MKWILGTYYSIGTVNTFTTLLVGIGVGIITARCLHILIESLGEDSKVPWKSIKKHVMAIIVLLLVYGGLLTMIKKYFN